MFVADSKVVIAPIPETSPVEGAYTWEQVIKPVEPFLEAVGARLAKQVATFDPELIPYADYALNGQGKHLRPVLVATQGRIPE